MASRIHIRKKNKGYVATFTNPIDKTNKKFNTTNIDNAYDFCSESDLGFYKEHSYLLPSGISLDKENDRFRVYSRYGYISTPFKTLMEAEEYKHNIISDLTEMKNIKTGKNGLFSN